MDTSVSKTVRWLLVVGLLATLAGLVIRYIQLNQTAQAHWISCRSCKTFIRLSMTVYADERGLTNGQPIELVTFNQYLATNNLFGTRVVTMKCPAGGSYAFGVVGETPTCSYTNQISYLWWDSRARRLRRNTTSHND
jgi:hypothetical protein